MSTPVTNEDLLYNYCRSTIQSVLKKEKKVSET